MMTLYDLEFCEVEVAIRCSASVLREKSEKNKKKVCGPLQTSLKPTALRRGTFSARLMQAQNTRVERKAHNLLKKREKCPSDTFIERAQVIARGTNTYK